VSTRPDLRALYKSAVVGIVVLSGFALVFSLFEMKALVFPFYMAIFGAIVIAPASIIITYPWRMLQIRLGCKIWCDLALSLLCSGAVFLLITEDSMMSTFVISLTLFCANMATALYYWKSVRALTAA
jgi:hypothetical protein